MAKIKILYLIHQSNTMGRYFGIHNKTSNQRVSSYWKGDPGCNCHDVMHQLHWSHTDEISSGCYDSTYEFEYDPETNTMNANELVPVYESTEEPMESYIEVAVIPHVNVD